MKKLLLLCLLLLVAGNLAARKHSAAEYLNSDNPGLDSLLLRLNNNVEWFMNEGVGKLDLNVGIRATSQSANYRWWTPLLQDLLPFDPRPNRLTELDATCKVSYQIPCDMLITPLTLSSDNRRRSRRILKQLYHVLLPIYDLKLMRDKGDDKEYILPFSTDGLRLYQYQISDTLVSNNDTTLTIRFSPKVEHHNLLNGEADIDMLLLLPKELRFQGLIDFGKMRDTIRFDIVNGYWMLQSSSIDLEYKYGKMRGLNHYDYEFNVKQLLPKKAYDPKLESLDLSDIYRTQPSDFISTDTTRRQPDTTHYSNNRLFLTKLPQRMVSSTTFETSHSDFRIYGPLNPAFIGYDKINGVTFRQRIRYNHHFDNGQGLHTQAEVGYASRLQAFRYKFNTEWVYNPRKRASVTLRLQNGSTGFSSRFKNDVDRILKRYNEESNSKLKDQLHGYSPYLKIPENKLSFDSLGLQYFNRYEFMLENTLELATGLRLYIGADYSIRRPIKHGVRSYIQDAADEAIDNRYLDMNPYLRIVWTPRQYYYYDNNQKLYLNSLWPTFSFQISKGVKNVLKSRANYCSLELDAQQQIRIGSARTLSWHIGGGGFFKQDEEYFVNYTYFARSQYPSTWDKRASGGAFALLDDYWYSSSPSYTQSHIMYESPFLLIHNWRLISKYVIKERLYASSLLAQGKNPYGELGYGIGNNYFNLSVFLGFMGEKPFDIGVKVSLEIDHHL